jgi:predicted dithiol-disulfide oxidoreductase (DUF899 family)
MQAPTIVSRSEWTAARKRLLAKEKELSRQRDALAAERRAMPVVAIEKEHVFQGPEGRRTLADLFGGRRQLLVYHFMFEPDADEGCPACSLVADNFGGLVHLGARDTAFAVVSRARSTGSSASGSAWDGTSRGSRPSAATSTTTSG